MDARLINTTSVSGIYGNMGQTNYGAAKAGIASFTLIAARELKRYAITVNCIAPGALTRLTEDLVVGEITDQMRAQRSPRWVAPIVTWLASSESKDVSGRIFEASGAIFVYATSLISVSMILASGLSFLGLGTKPPTPEWGLMLNTLRTAIYVQPWVAALPGAAIFITSISFNLLSDGLRTAMDNKG